MRSTNLVRRSGCVHAMTCVHTPRVVHNDCQALGLLVGPGHIHRILPPEHTQGYAYTRHLPPEPPCVCTDERARQPCVYIAPAVRCKTSFPRRPCRVSSGTRLPSIIPLRPSSMAARASALAGVILRCALNFTQFLNMSELQKRGQIQS